MTNLRQDSMTGEQWVLEERSADPPSTEEGERWLRTDLNSGDKIATLRVDVGSSIHDVPIFSTGTAVDTVSEAMRIQVNNTTGYVPIAPVSDAAFPELRMQHNSQVHGFHDRVEPGSAIPDTAVLHSTAADYDGSKWVDQVGSNNVPDAQGDPSVVSDQINGYPAVYYDGGDISQTTTDVASSDPISVIFTARVRSPGGDAGLIDGGSGNAFHIRDLSGNEDHRLYRGGSAKLIAEPFDSNWHVWALTGTNGTDLALDIDGSNISSGALSSNILDGLTFAGDGDVVRAQEMDWAEFTVLENHTTAEKDEEVQRQANKYGISTA
jgi:hypothetical protein